MSMACHVIPFIGLCLGTILVQGMQPGPRHGARLNPNQDMPRSTILSAMSSELTSVYGNCSFPPKDVLTNADSFDFLGMCNIRTPHVDMSVTEEGVIRCLGLLEVGFRLCSLEEKYFKNGELYAVPKDTHDFNSLLDEVNKENDPNLCIDLKNVMDVLDDNEFPVINKWNLKKIFHESDESCTRICFDLKNNPRLMCKLILWGSKLLLQKDPPPFGSNITNRLSANQPGNPHLGLDQDQANKKITSPSTLGPDISAPQGDDEFHESQENVHVSSKNEDRPTETGHRLVGSSSTTNSFEANQRNDADEGRMEQPMSILQSSVDGPLETSSKSGAKKNADASKLIPKVPMENNEPSDAMVSEEELKNIDSLTGSSPTSKHKVDNLDGDTRKGKTNPTSLTDSLKTKDVAEENSVVGQGDKTLLDIDARGEDLGLQDNYDASLGPNLDDDDVNIPLSIEQEQPAINQEPTGFKTDYKSPREELANGNTILQERFVDSEDSHFFSYFMAMVVLCIVGYVVFHNKQKILALALEGRSKRGSRRRPVTANYHKLDNNLEEAVSSPCSTSVTHVIY